MNHVLVQTEVILVIRIRNRKELDDETLSNNYGNLEYTLFNELGSRGTVFNI